MHQCVRCGQVYENSAKEILEGCSCGSKFFFFSKKEENLTPVAETGSEEGLSEEDRMQIENDVKNIIGDDLDESKPVILNLENIRILKPGKYELDLAELFKGENPLIYKLEEGKYMIDLATSLMKKSE